MASLTGNQIKDTYQGLLKTTDNGVLGTDAKEITDGAGNGSGVSLSTNGNVSLTGDLSVGDDIVIVGDASVGGSLTLGGALIDSNGNAGTGGQVLASTETGTDWVSLSEIQGVDGTGTANKIAKWSDTDTIANSTITDDGALVSFATPISVSGAVSSTGANTASSFVKTGGVSTEFLKADGSVDGTVYATEADLTTAEGRISVNEGDIVAIEAKTDFITVTQPVDLDTMESGIATNASNIATNASNISANSAAIASNDSDISALQSGKVAKSGDTMTGNLTAPAFVKTGGTSAQFLKADGSIDSNAYITAESDTLDSVTDRGAVTTNTVTVGDLNAQASSLNSLSVVTTSSFTGDAAFDVDTLYVDVSADSVGINTNLPTEALDVVGNIKASGSVSGATLAGTLSTAAQPNVTSVGTLSSLAVSGNLTVDTDTLFVDSVSNKVSIGAGSAFYKLNVKAGSGDQLGLDNAGERFTQMYWRNNGTDKSALWFDNTENSFYMYGYSGCFLGFASSGTERMRIKADGDIFFRDSSANEAFYWDASAASLGIGTAIPNAALTVKSIEDAAKGISIWGRSDSISTLRFFDSTGATEQGGLISTSTYLGFNYAGTEKMRIDSLGQVTMTASAGDNLTLVKAAGAALNWSDGTQVRCGIHAINGADGMTFRTGSAQTERMRIDSSGNVLIGSQSPVGSRQELRIGGNAGGSAIQLGRSTTNKATIQLDSGDNLEIFTSVASPIIFSTNSLEKMRITSGGNVCIGATAQVSGEVFLVKTSSGGTSIATQSTADSYIPIRFLEADGDLAGYISAATGSVAYNTSSDYRLKENVVELTGALDRIDNIKPCRFNFIKNPSRTVDGFLAHELQEVVPEAVHGEKDATEIRSVKISDEVLDEEGNVITEAVYEEQEVPVYQGIDQSKIVPLLAAGLQEAHALIKELRAELNALKQA